MSSVLRRALSREVAWAVKLFADDLEPIGDSDAEKGSDEDVDADSDPVPRPPKKMRINAKSSEADGEKKKPSKDESGDVLKCEWCRELSLSYRDGETGVEHGEVIEGVTDEVMAKFEDGSIAVISNMSRQMVNDATSGRPSGGGEKREHLWTGTHAETKHELSIRIRLSRSHNLALFEQSKQVDQITLKQFNDWYNENGGKLEFNAEGNPVLNYTDHPAVVAGLKFFTPYAMKYAAHELSLKKMKEEKRMP